MQELDADLAAGFLDQDQYAAARHDLERELLYDVDATRPATIASRSSSTLGRWALGAVLAIAVPSSVVVVYLTMGQPGMIDRLETQAANPSDAATTADGQKSPSLDVLIPRLVERLREKPADLEGWLMLGRTYFATNQLAEGLKAIEKAYALAPDQAEVKLAYAEALAAASPNKSLEGRPAELIQAVLAQEPGNPTARWLNGMISFQRGQYQVAATAWQKILDELDPASEEANNLRQMVAEANNRAGTPANGGTARNSPAEPDPALASPAGPEPVTAAAASEMPATTPADSQIAVTLDVSLDPGIASKASPDDTVFVFARAAQGPPMPLAAKRFQVKDLPITVTLDDSLAMTPAMRLSAFPEVLLGARVSKSGDAMPQSGDLVGEAGPIHLQGRETAKVVIDRVRP